MAMPPASREKHRETQPEKFRKLAKESEVDQDEAAFKKRLEKIAKPPKGKPAKGC
jgi:hypothetical protein